MTREAVRATQLNGYSEPAAYVKAQLTWLLDYARTLDVRFNACLAEARKQFNREVREQADATPLPK